jgi:hypothetical protein
MDTTKYKLTRYDCSKNGCLDAKYKEKLFKVSYEYPSDLVEKVINSIKEFSSDMDCIKSICIIGEKDSIKKYITLEELL